MATLLVFFPSSVTQCFLKSLFIFYVNFTKKGDAFTFEEMGAFTFM